MNLELEKYIDMALIDGVTSESERTFLEKKAIQLGVENDEFEFVLNAKVDLKAKELFSAEAALSSAQNSESTKSRKEGVLLKCPSSGLAGLSRLIVALVVMNIEV